MGTFFKGLQEVVFLSQKHAVSSAGQSKTPVDPSGCSSVFSESFQQFLVSLESQLGCSSIFASSEEIISLAPVLINNLTVDCQKKLIGRSKEQTRTLEKRKIDAESSRKTPGSILRSLPVSLTVSPSKTRTFGLKTQILEPRNNFPQ